MTQLYLLAYVFTTFVTGAACLGATLLLRRGDSLGRAFLLLYLPLSVLVLAALLLAFLNTLPDVSSAARSTLEYLEDIVGRYAVMLALPLFAHRVYGPRGRVRDGIFVALVLVAFVGQHLTEFVLPDAWDHWGDAAEDVLFAAIVLYTLWLALPPWRVGHVYAPMARRFLGLLLLGLPVVGYDLLRGDGLPFRLYPLWYCASGVTMVLTLVSRRPALAGTIPPAWQLSARETEVVRLLQEGLRTEQIARRLTISPNTVKTHLQAIFAKSGFRTRSAVAAALASSAVASPGRAAIQSD